MDLNDKLCDNLCIGVCMHYAVGSMYNLNQTLFDYHVVPKRKKKTAAWEMINEQFYLDPNVVASKVPKPSNFRKLTDKFDDIMQEANEHIARGNTSRYDGDLNGKFTLVQVIQEGIEKERGESCTF